ncbi:MazG nucleotide pyrophosphohydrolase domain-containing protein [Actinoplanes sp. CA-030573]|uniref:MazG nucleotide pyrophosphohydrolase domain-containing protein n=1 Tax=Actinoplanes sp. CA-030573 TaxID=3239898 RepID=UPI003D8AA90B
MSESPWRLVREFHEVFGLAHADRPASIPAELAVVRQRLLDEEVAEVVEASAAVQQDPSPERLASLARELADVVYVAYGTAISHGIDLDAVIAEVHRANMSKLGDDGRPVVRDGKVQKGPNFRPPDLASLFDR